MGEEKQRFTSRVLLAKSVFLPAQQWVVPALTRISLVVWLMGTICARSLDRSLHLYSTLFPPGWCSPYMSVSWEEALMAHGRLW